MSLRRFIIERNIPKVGSLQREKVRTKITEIRKIIDPTTAAPYAPYEDH
jgi:hypothetical protein